MLSEDAQNQIISEGQDLLSYSQDVWAARFLTQVFKDLHKILAAFPAVKAQDADAALAELRRARRGCPGRRGEENRFRGAFLEQQQRVGRGHARGNGYRQRLAFDRPVKPCGQQRVVGMERIAADEDGAPGPPHIGAEFMHLTAGRFSGNPAGMPGAGGDAAATAALNLRDALTYEVA